MKVLFIALGALSLCSCGTTLTYTSEHGFTVREKIDGKLNPEIEVDSVKGYNDGNVNLNRWLK